MYTRIVAALVLGMSLLFSLSACGVTDSADDPLDPTLAKLSLRVGAIPDQDPELLQRRFGLVSDYLAGSLGTQVEYVPVVDYVGAVTAFAVGEIDLVWFGGLTGVQARLQVPGAQAIVQRDIDAEFHSVFIASSESGIEPFENLSGLSSLEGKALDVRQRVFHLRPLDAPALHVGSRPDVGSARWRTGLLRCP